MREHELWRDDDVEFYYNQRGNYHRHKIGRLMKRYGNWFFQPESLHATGALEAISPDFPNILMPTVRIKYATPSISGEYWCASPWHEARKVVLTVQGKSSHAFHYSQA